MKIEMLKSEGKQMRIKSCPNCGMINPDMVNHPNHYTGGKVECIDAIESAVCGLKGIEAVCTANAIKYLWRWKNKNGCEDLKKARWYIERLIKMQEGINANADNET